MSESLLKPVPTTLSEITCRYMVRVAIQRFVEMLREVHDFAAYVDLALRGLDDAQAQL